MSGSLKAQVARSLLELVDTEAGFRARFCFASRLSVFAGHFPGDPVVPGVFLIEAVRLGVQRALGRGVRIASVSRAKFLARVLPDEAVVIDADLREVDDSWRCHARGLRAGQPVCEVRARLSPVEGARG